MVWVAYNLQVSCLAANSRAVLNLYTAADPAAERLGQHSIARHLRR